jgi:hypothetical protein
MPCTTCKSFRRVKNYQSLEVNWTTSFKDCATKYGRIKITKGMLGDMDGRLVAEEIASSPSQIEQNGFNNFRSVLEGERTLFGGLPSVRVIDTRQRIFSFPGTEVVFTYCIRGGMRVSWFMGTRNELSSLKNTHKTVAALSAAPFCKSLLLIGFYVNVCMHVRLRLLRSNAKCKGFQHMK